MSRLRVLHVCMIIPFPPDYGGRIATWNHLRADARHADVGLVTLVEEMPDEATLGAMGEVLQTIRCVRRPRGREGALGALRALVSGYPVNLARYRWPVFGAAVEEVARAWRPDVVVAQHLHMAPFPLRVPGVARILRHHNIDSTLIARLGATTPNPVTGALLRGLANQVRQDERRHCPRYDRCVVMTPDDQSILARIAPDARTAVLPAGLPVEEYRIVAPPPAGAPPTLVTAGTLVFQPTAEGVIGFVREAWPLVRRRHPDATFRIIGNCPPGVRAELAGAPGVELRGRVDSVRDALEGAHAFVVPLRAGSGMRIKILEACAFGLPVVSTTIGAEGIPVTPGRELLIADDPAAQAEAIHGLFVDPDRNAALRRAGRAFVEERYSLTALSAQTERLYHEALGR